MTDPILRMTGIVKQFPEGVRALDGVDLDVLPGEVHCLLGQNGAGKWTLIEVLTEAHQPDEGTVTWQGEQVRLADPSAATRLGIATICRSASIWSTAYPLPRTSSSDASRHRGLRTARRAEAHHRRLARPAGAPGDLTRHRAGSAVRSRRADGRHGACAIAQRATHRHGRAVGRPRRGGGQAAVRRP